MVVDVHSNTMVIGSFFKKQPRGFLCDYYSLINIKIKDFKYINIWNVIRIIRNDLERSSSSE